MPRTNFNTLERLAFCLEAVITEKNTNKHVNHVVIRHLKKSLMLSEEVGGGKAGGHYCWHKKGKRLTEGLLDFKRLCTKKKGIQNTANWQEQLWGSAAQQCSVLSKWLQVQNESELYQLWSQEHNGNELDERFHFSLLHFIKQHL